MALASRAGNTRRDLHAAMIAAGLSSFEARARFEESLGSLPERLPVAQSVDVPGIGAFVARVTIRPARQGVNPFTRETITFPARTITRILFEPEGALLSAVNARAAGLSLSDASDPLEQAFASVLIGAGTLKLAGIGAFRIIKVPARRARIDPSTGAVLAPAMPASREVRFRPASSLKAAVVRALAGDGERREG
jgi:nucleoid DNA-binding protein